MCAAQCNLFRVRQRLLTCRGEILQCLASDVFRDMFVSVFFGKRVEIDRGGFMSVEMKVENSGGHGLEKSLVRVFETHRVEL